MYLFLYFFNHSLLHADVIVSARNQPKILSLLASLLRNW